MSLNQSEQPQQAANSARLVQASSSSSAPRPEPPTLVAGLVTAHMQPSQTNDSSLSGNPSLLSNVAQIGSQNNPDKQLHYPQYSHNPFPLHTDLSHLVAAAAFAHQSQDFRNFPTFNQYPYPSANAWAPTFPPPPASSQLTQRPYATTMDDLILATKIEQRHSQEATITTSGAKQLPPQTSLTSAAPNAHGDYPPLSSSSFNAYQSTAGLPSVGFMAPNIPSSVGRGLTHQSSDPNKSSQSDFDTSQVTVPRNKSERELHQVLMRANLLQYFDTFLRFGGDDVEQLSDADEDEFMEIMKLIGMTSKPLHIRRLQKGLNEWRENQSIYESIDPSSKRTGEDCNAQRNQSSFYGTHLAAGMRQPPARSSSYIESPAPTPTNSEISNTLLTPFNEPSQQEYCTPHEIFVGAPKRPILKDSIKPRDLTKTYHSDIPTPDARQLDVKRAIYDKRKRAKMARDHSERRSPKQRPCDMDRKLTPTSISPPARSLRSPDSPNDSCSEAEKLDEQEERNDEPIINVGDNVKRKTSARASLLERFNNCSNNKQLLVVDRNTSSPPKKE